MKEHKYTFPVIVGGELVQKLFLADGGTPNRGSLTERGAGPTSFGHGCWDASF